MFIYLFLAGKLNLVWQQPLEKLQKLGRGEMFKQKAQALLWELGLNMSLNSTVCFQSPVFHSPSATSTQANI